MVNRLVATLFCSLFISFSSFTAAAVILQYHHVSDITPNSTSITPTQFRIHLQYIKDHNFKVVPLSQIIEAIKNNRPLVDKTVAITFDDSYLDIVTNGTPLLEEFNYPYTIFINPDAIELSSNKKSSKNITWKQLKYLSDRGVIIANHGLGHISIARIEDGYTQKQWLAKQGKLLLKAEAIIKEKTGQNWQYFAYPYGEYTPEIQHWITQHGFVGLSQQSGAAGNHSELSSIPRFPASQPYDQINDLQDKLNALPLNMMPSDNNTETVFKYKNNSRITFNVFEKDLIPSQLGCYITGLGKQKIHWLDDVSFTITFDKPLPIGRVRCNCTAQSISQPGRYYWYSKLWFIVNKDGSWFHL